MTLEKGKPTEYLPVTISKEQAAYLLHTIWPKAPDAEVIKAAILCQQYGLNPLMRQVYLIEFGKDWVVVLGIKATRQIAQQALKGRGIRYSYADGPRVMTEKEQIAIRGEVELGKIWAITKLKDSEGNTYPGYGFWPVSKQPYGIDKGNDAHNMAFIRSERNALDKLAPGALPDIEVADDSYVVTDYRMAIEKGKQEFSSEVDRDIKGLWPAEKPTPKTLRTPSPDELKTTTSPVAEETDNLPEEAVEPAPQIDSAWLKETLEIIHWKESTALSWMKAHLKASGNDLMEVLNSLDNEQRKVFVGHISSMREASGR